MGTYTFRKAKIKCLVRILRANTGFNSREDKLSNGKMRFKPAIERQGVFHQVFTIMSPSFCISLLLLKEYYAFLVKK